jgi:alpha-glucosidase
MFDEPLLTYGAHPRTLLEHPAAAMIKSIPSVWDETLVLPPSEVGELAAFARRRGDQWFLAIVNGPRARRLSVPLAFLGPGTYQSLHVGDAGPDPTQVDVGETSVRHDGMLEVNLNAGGGYIARYSRDASIPAGDEQ